MSVNLFVDWRYLSVSGLKHYDSRPDLETLLNFIHGGGEIKTQNIYGTFGGDMVYMIQNLGFDVISATPDDRIDLMIQDINDLPAVAGHWIVVVASSPKLIQSLRKAKKEGALTMLIGFNEFMEKRLVDSVDFYLPFPLLFKAFRPNKKPLPGTPSQIVTPSEMSEADTDIVLESE